MYIYVRTLRKQVLQQRKLDGCPLHTFTYCRAVALSIVPVSV